MINDSYLDRGKEKWAVRSQHESSRHLPRASLAVFYRFIPSASAYTAILLGAPRGDPTPIRGSVSTVPSLFSAFCPFFRAP